MPTNAWTTLAILIAMLGLLVWNRLPVWLVFIITLTAAMTLGLAPAASLLKGFSNTGVITVAVLYPSPPECTRPAQSRFCLNG
jgi:di/tricarboxylate transporter